MQLYWQFIFRKMIGIQKAAVHLMCTPVCGLSKVSDGFHTWVERNYDGEEQGYIPTVCSHWILFKVYQYVLESMFYLGDIVAGGELKQDAVQHLIAVFIGFQKTQQDTNGPAVSTKHHLCPRAEKEGWTTSATLLKMEVKTGHLPVTLASWETLARGVSEPCTPLAFPHVTWSMRIISPAWAGSPPGTQLLCASFWESSGWQYILCRAPRYEINFDSIKMYCLLQ